MMSNVSPFRFAVISDTHIRPMGESSSPWKTNLLTNDRARWVVRKVASYNPDFTIHLGDIVHPVPHLPIYKSASNVAKEIFGDKLPPIYYVPGNHDIGDKDNPTVPAYIVNKSYLRTFKRYIGPTYQSFDHKGIHFILINTPILNSGLPEEERQKKWLEKDLRTNKDKAKLVFSHYPPYLYKPEEPSNYDNIDMPERKWLLDLLVKFEVKAFFAGHVHQYGYKKHGEMHIYNLLSTCFVRQDFSEMFRVKPADEYGRNDVAKLGFCIVDLDENGHNVKIIRSYGKTLEKGKELSKQEKIQKLHHFDNLFTSFGVHLRHPFEEIVKLPYMAPIDEFVRKKARNDYPQLALREAGIRTIRLPLDDLIDDDARQHLFELYSLGHRYGFFSVNIPNIQLIKENRDIIDFLEIIFPWEKTRENLPRLFNMRKDTGIPVYIANIESSIHRQRKGPKFSHFVSHGFHLDKIGKLEEIISDKGKVDGFVFQVKQMDRPLEQLEKISDYSEKKGFNALVNVKLSSENPAEYQDNDDYVANRVAEAVIASYAYRKMKVFLDTFIDHDRGYFPRIGLYDRSINPRKGGHVVRNLQSALMVYGADIKITDISNNHQRQIYFDSSSSHYRLSLPGKGNTLFKPLEDSIIIDLVSGEIITQINPKVQTLEISTINTR